MEQLVARRAHNPKVIGSSPIPATKTNLKTQRISLGFIIFQNKKIWYILKGHIKKNIPFIFILFYNCFIRLDISIAVAAASKPLLPAFVPALSIACSIVSVVRTPNITGMSDSRDTLATPFVTSLET